MKKLALLLALCLFVQCIGVSVALSDEIPAVEEVAPVEEAVPAEALAEVLGEEEAPAEETNPAEEAATVEEAAPVAEEAAPVVEAFQPYQAILKAGIILYKDAGISIELGKVAKDAIVEVTGEENGISAIKYAVAENSFAEAYVKGQLENAGDAKLEIVEFEKEEPVVEETPADVADETAPTVEDAAPAVVEAAPTEESAPAPAEAPAVAAEQPVDEVASVGDGAAATFVAVPSEGEATDVLGTGEYDLPNDVLGVGDASREYKIRNNRIIEYTGNDSVVQIPLRVYNSTTGLDEVVQGIERGAFRGNKTVTQIIIPTTVTWIDDEAFKDCTALVTINLPDLVSNISSAAFSGCTALQSVSWTDTVTTIQDRAFYGCTSLTTLGTSRNVTRIGDYAFYNCASLTSISWSDNLQRIGKYCYANCTGLTGLSFPGALTTVEDYAFAGCTGIKSIEFQTNTTLQNINTGAFKDCRALKAIYIPDSVRVIGISAFENCSSATVLSLPAGTGGVSNLAIIQDSAFRNCSSLTELSIPNGVQEIHQYAFEGCANVGFVYTIPASVILIGQYAFSGLRADCTFVVENAGVVLSDFALGNSGIIFGWIPSSAQNYANSHPGFSFYDIRIVNYVRRCYNIILRRPMPITDGDGVIYWSKKLARREMAGGDIVHSFMFSNEFATIVRTLPHTTTSIAGVLYWAMLGRDPALDPAGVAYWQSFLDIGCSYDYLISGFCNSTEFHGICDSYGINPGIIPLTQNRDKNPAVTAFVDRCYEFLMVRAKDPAGAHGEPDGLNYWTGKLLSRVMNGGEVASSFVDSAEFKGLGLPPTGPVGTLNGQINRLYKAMMDRDGELGGLNYWKAFMDDGMSIQYVVRGFSGSIEFAFLCQKAGIDPGPITPSEYRDWNANVTRFVSNLCLHALGRGASAAELNNWCGRIVTRSGAAARTAVAQVAKEMYTSYECALRWLTPAQFVDEMWGGYKNIIGSYTATAAEKTTVGFVAGTLTKTYAQMADIVAATPAFALVLDALGI